MTRDPFLRDVVAMLDREHVHIRWDEEDPFDPAWPAMVPTQAVALGRRLALLVLAEQRA
jgi:hypothetical protein